MGSGPGLAPRTAVMSAIHKLIERNAATRGDDTAIIDGNRQCSYRDLNATANQLARRLMTEGLRRGHHACVRMKPSIELATTLLAIVKVGAVYTLVDEDSPRLGVPEGISIRIADGLRHLGVIPIGQTACSPNLPVITRPTDIACVLEGGAVAGPLSVPHATITSMKMRAMTSSVPWTGGKGAFELWIALMNGSAAVVEESAEVVAA